MFVVQFQFGSPVLLDALGRVPELSIEYEEIFRNEGGIDAMFWAEGGDFDAFEEAVADDPTVTDLRRLAETETRRLYRVTYTDRGVEIATFPEWRTLNIGFLDAAATHEGWKIRLRMPDRETLGRYIEACEGRNIEFQLRSIREESDDDTATDVRLTTAQREALLAARELGYFDVPRSATLADVGERCGVSAQAASERLRRGCATLVDAAVSPDSA